MKTIYNTSKVQLDFKRGTKNNLLSGACGYLGLLVKSDENQSVCPYSNALIGYTVQTHQGTVIAKVAFQKDAMTLLTILEGETYSKQGLTWNESKIGYIHLKDTSMLTPSHIKEVVSLLPETVKVLTAESHVKSRIRKARRLR